VCLVTRNTQVLPKYKSNLLLRMLSPTWWTAIDANLYVPPICDPSRSKFDGEL